MIELKKQTPPQVPPRRPFPRSGKRIQVESVARDDIVKFLSFSGVMVAWAGLIMYLVSLSTK